MAKGDFSVISEFLQEYIFIYQLHNEKISLKYFRINICKNLLTKKYPDLDGFINRFPQTFKKEVTTVLYKFYQRTEKKRGGEQLSTCFWGLQRHLKNKNYRWTSFVNIYIKILNRIPANQI